MKTGHSNDMNGLKWVVAIPLANKYVSFSYKFERQPIVRTVMTRTEVNDWLRIRGWIEVTWQDE